MRNWLQPDPLPAAALRTPARTPRRSLPRAGVRALVGGFGRLVEVGVGGLADGLVEAGVESSGRVVAASAGPRLPLSRPGRTQGGEYRRDRSYVGRIRALELPFSGGGFLAPPAACAPAVAFAYLRVGTAYEWGGDGSDARFDCSGLVFFATDLTDPASIHHVGLYGGEDQIIDAPCTGAVIRFDTINQPDSIGAVRPVAGNRQPTLPLDGALHWVRRTIAAASFRCLGPHPPDLPGVLNQRHGGEIRHSRPR